MHCCWTEGTVQLIPDSFRKLKPGRGFQALNDMILSTCTPWLLPNLNCFPFYIGKITVLLPLSPQDSNLQNFTQITLMLKILTNASIEQQNLASPPGATQPGKQTSNLPGWCWTIKKLSASKTIHNS